MIKNNKLKYLISAILILIPSVVSLFLKGQMTSVMQGAWYFTWIMPVVLLVIHTGSLVLVQHIDKVKQDAKIENMIFFIIPAISLYAGSIFIAISLGFDTGVEMICSVLLGILLIVTGNYMPKAKRNRTYGIKIKWTLENDDNWVATHRLAGKLFVGAGIVTLFIGFLPVEIMFIVFAVILAITVAVPIAYSYRYHLRQVADGTATKDDSLRGDNKKAGIASGVVVASLLVILVPIMLFGKIGYTLGDNSLNIKPTFGGGIDITYSELADAEIEYRAETVPGHRVAGFGSPKLLYGQFKNDEFGMYTRYTYTDSNSAIVIRIDDKILVIADETPELTKALYDALLEKIT